MARVLKHAKENFVKNDVSGRNMKFGNTPPSYVLGGDYSSDQQMPTFRPCIGNGTMVYSGGAKSILHFGNSGTFDEIETRLNVDVSEAGSIGLFSESISASYAKYIKDTDYTLSFYYFEQITLPTEFFYPDHNGEKALNEYGADAYQQGPDYFRALCGDQLIEQNHLGAGLYVTLKVEFSSLDDKSTFIANAGAKYGNMFSVSGKISKIVNEHHMRGTLEVSGLQIGGDASQLGEIFTEGPDPYAVTLCSLEDLGACQKTINGVLAYAAKVFPEQINFQNGKVLGSAASQGYTFMPLTNLALNVGNSTITPEIEAARVQLGKLYLHLQDEQVFITHIIDSSIFNSFFNDVQDRIRETYSNLNSNIKMLNNQDSGAMQCYYSPTECLNVLNYLNQKLLPIDENFIDRIKNSYNFTILCEICDDDECYANDDCPSAGVSSIALSIDNNGNFIWDYLGYNNTFTILKNNDHTISLKINGASYPEYSEIPINSQGQYLVENAYCRNSYDPIPHPFDDQYCFDDGSSWGAVTMVLESIFNGY